MAVNLEIEHLSNTNYNDYHQIVSYIDSLAKEALIKELEQYHDKNEHIKIVESLEKYPKEHLDVLLISILARAYNNVQNYQKAFELLKPLEKECKKLPVWNYRMAYSCYYLDRDDLALTYFYKYLNSNDVQEAEKVEINEYIEIINQNKNYPYFSSSFKSRVEKVWEHFIEEEKFLLTLLSKLEDKHSGEELLAKIKQILAPLFIEPSFGLSYNNGKWELTISSDLDDSIFPAYIYFKNRMPAKLDKKWHLHIGRQASKKESFIDLDGEKIFAKDVLVHIRKVKKDSFKIKLYHEKLVYNTQEEYNTSYEIAYILTEQILGEVRYIKFIEETDISNKSFTKSISLDKLPDFIKNSITLDISIQDQKEKQINNSKNSTNDNESLDREKNKEKVHIKFVSGMTEEDWNKHANPEYLFQKSVEYLLPEKFIAEQGKIQTFRNFGKTTIPRIVNAFIQSIGDDIAQEYHSCGAFIGMFIMKFNFSKIQEDIHYLGSINSRLNAKLDKDHFVYGSAFGFGYVFLDFIAWDLEAVVNAFIEIVKEDSNINFAGVKSIRTDSDLVRYK